MIKTCNKIKDMRKYILYVIIGLLSFAGCTTDDILTFGTEHEIYFEKYFMDEKYPGTATADSTEVTFFFAEEDDPYVLGDLVMILSGRKLEKDLNFSLKVVEEMTTALPEEYTLQDQYVFRAMPLDEESVMYTDTIHIQLNRSERLKDMPDGIRLTLEIVPNEEVGVGPYERSRAVIRIMQDPVQPLWWTEDVALTLLGDYSPLKYKTFLQKVEGAEKLDGAMIKDHPDQAIRLVREFKMYLEKNPTYELDGTRMTVNV